MTGKRIRKQLLFTAILLPCLFSSLGAQDRVYTNDDLKTYRAEPTPRPSIVPDREVPGRINNQSTPGGQPQIRTEDMERLVGPVLMRISGCQTLEEGLLGKKGSIDTCVVVSGRGRTVEEICETLGQGCQYCGKASK